MSGGGKPGNKNALKHGLYALHYTPEEKSGLKDMPVDEFLMELNTLRLIAAELLTEFRSCKDSDKKSALADSLINALNSAVNVIQKRQLLAGDAPVLKDLWDVIKDVNLSQGVDNAV